MPLEDKKPEIKLSIRETENAVMDSRLPEEIKSALLKVLRNERLAASICSDYEFPDFSDIGLLVAKFELTVDPITEETRQMLRMNNIFLPENDTLPSTSYLYFVAKDQSVVSMLEQAFIGRKYDLIKKTTEESGPTIH